MTVAGIFIVYYGDGSCQEAVYIFYANTVGGVIYDPSSCKNLQYPNTGLLQSEARQRRRFVGRPIYLGRGN